MDRLIKRFDFENNADLRICSHRGVAYQADMGSQRIAYDRKYFEHYKQLEGSAIATALNNARCAMLARHATAGEASVLDFGAGCGTFVKQAISWGYEAKGFDVIPETIQLLQEMGAFASSAREFDVVTFWDSLEHVEEPEIAFRRIRKGALVLVAVPIIADIADVRSSKHYKPGEHLYYWTRDGFVSWMGLWGFRLLEESSHEVDAGRECIGAFAFRRDLPDYDDHINAYAQMHFERFYGSSATELHLETVAAVVRDLKPGSILDFGCGRSDLVAHFWRDGERRIARYDPAIRKIRIIPDESFSLVLCCDVMEHIPMASVDLVLSQIRGRSSHALFTISTKLARAKLPDGRNAHVTLLTKQEWTRWITEKFGTVQVLPTNLDTELVLLARPQ